jgi:hypothetical protein
LQASRLQVSIYALPAARTLRSVLAILFSDFVERSSLWAVAQWQGKRKERMASPIPREWVGLQQFPAATQTKLHELLGKLKEEVLHYAFMQRSMHER